MSNRCRGCSDWMGDTDNNTCWSCQERICPQDPNKEDLHPRGTGPDDCTRCLRAAKEKLTAALKMIAVVYPSDNMCRACQEVGCADISCDGFIARQALIDAAGTGPVSRVALDNLQVLQEAETPNADGWWALREDGRVRWHRVEVTDDSGPCIYVPAFHEMVPVSKFTHPLTKWFGPVTLPWRKDD